MINIYNAINYGTTNIKDISERFESTNNNLKHISNGNIEYNYILGKFNRSRRLSKKYILKRYNEPGIFEIFRGKYSIEFDVLSIIPDESNNGSKWKSMGIIEAFRNKISFKVKKDISFSYMSSYISNKNIFEISEYIVKNLFSIYNQLQRDYVNIE